MYYDATYFILIPAIILTFYAQFKVKRNFAKFSRVPSGTGITGAKAARIVLDANGLTNVSINPVGGSLTDHYDPSKQTVNLSQSVYGETSIAALAVACHECGHAIQHSKNYGLLSFRNTLVPVANITSNISWPLAIVGIILIGAGSMDIGNLLFMVGVGFFGIVVLFHLVTLPVELNASSRALKQMVECNLIDSDEKRGARKVLSAAALTYVAALATALANMLRLIAMRNRSR